LNKRQIAFFEFSFVVVTLADIDQFLTNTDLKVMGNEMKKIKCKFYHSIELHEISSSILTHILIRTVIHSRFHNSKLKKHVSIAIYRKIWHVDYFL
jgi:hypothetical protein